MQTSSRKDLDFSNGYSAKIRIKHTNKILQCKACCIRFEGGIDAELHRLLQEVIIEPVEFLKWTAPIVPVMTSTYYPGLKISFLNWKKAKSSLNWICPMLSNRFHWTKIPGSSQQSTQTRVYSTIQDYHLESPLHPLSFKGLWMES